MKMRTKNENQKHRGLISELMEKYEIEHIGGCVHCQPNGDLANGWGSVPGEVFRAFDKSDSCCSEINTEGNTIRNYPCYCKFFEEEDL